VILDPHKNVVSVETCILKLNVKLVLLQRRGLGSGCELVGREVRYKDIDRKISALVKSSERAALGS